MGNINHSGIRPPAKQTPPEQAQVVFQGQFFEVRQWQQELRPGQYTTFETVARPDTALVLPIIRRGKALLARESQPGMKPVLRTIGGKIKKGEPPDVAARRELLEETGFEAGELRLWNAWQPVNKMDWAVYLFVAHDLRRVSTPELEPGESIATREISISALLHHPTKLGIDDYEFMYHIFRATADPKEMRRVKALFAFKPIRR